MTCNLHDLINEQTHANCATNAGRDAHTKLRHVFFTPAGWVGDKNLVSQIQNISELCELFGPLSKTEVPIAGTINGKFISRRIDRLYVNNDTKTIVVLDYKTDINKKLYYEKYVEQLKEYCALLKCVYQHFDIQCKILWLNDFALENIPTKGIM